MKLVSHFLATSVLCGLSFVAGVLCASEPERPAAPDDAAAAAASSADEPQIEAPGDTLEIPADRPAWTSSKPDYRGDRHTFPVSSGPYARERDARQALDRALVSATSEYITDQFGPGVSRAIRFDAKTIKQKLVKPENTHRDVARYSVGPMHEVFVLLEAGPAFRKEVAARYKKVEASGRLQQTGVAAGGSLLALAAAFAVFRARSKP